MRVLRRPVLESAVVLRVGEDRCLVEPDGDPVAAGYAPQLPTPYTERQSPGHRLATVTGGEADLELENVARLCTDHGLRETAMAPHEPGAR